jgi:chorismate mutase
MNSAQLEELSRRRAEIERLDEAILTALANRAQAVQRLWKWKNANGLALFDKAHEAKVIERLVTRGRSMGLLPSEVEPVVRAFVGKKLVP